MEQAKYLQANLKRKDVTIILTGSMIPLDGFNMSDAAFNLGFAIASFESAGAGIYICMNGKLFTTDEVIKELDKGRFASVLGEK